MNKFINTMDNLRKVSNTSIRTSDGFLSAYGFACSYCERRESDNISLEIYKEHGVYHVRFNRFDLPYSLRKDCKGWESFGTLREAKDLFFKLCTQFNFIKIKN